MLPSIYDCRISIHSHGHHQNRLNNLLQLPSQLFPTNICSINKPASASLLCSSMSSWGTFRIIPSYFSLLIFAFFQGLAVRYCFLVMPSLAHGLRWDSFFRRSWELFYSVIKFKSSLEFCNFFCFDLHFFLV